MSKEIFELFGKPLNDQSEETKNHRSAAYCPFMNAKCDGGGNRHQTTINLENTSFELREFFKGIDRVVPGICSIQSERETWLVCPRRLFGLRSPNKELLEHERKALEAVGLPAGQKLGVWSEVNVSVKAEESSFNYHFDYVVSPVENISVEALPQEIKQDRSLFRELRDRAIEGRLTIPTLDNFVIIEVMTASTSGSNKVKETDIASAFRNAVLGRPHEAPGINKRQVWGRMATQLFAKSACAEKWGGKTSWWLQDQFFAEIEATTMLNRLYFHDKAIGKFDNINIVLFYIDPKTGKTKLDTTISGYAGLPYTSANETFTGILLPKEVPEKQILLKAMLRKHYSAQFVL